MRKFTRLIATIFAASLILIACQKEVSNAKNYKEAFNDKSVKEWYYGTFKKSPEWAGYNSSLNKRKLPDWKHGTYIRFGDKEIVEFPLVKEKSTFSIIYGRATRK